jgi:molybdopterin synthase sulfur carrier subunit
MATVRIPTPLHSLTGGKDKVSVQAANIAEMIEALDKQFPSMKDRLCDANGKVRSSVLITVDEEDVRFMEGMNTKLEAHTEVSIIPAVAGGAKVKKKRPMMS